jgi:hypothetical protein
MLHLKRIPILALPRVTNRHFVLFEIFVQVLAITKKKLNKKLMNSLR